MTTNPTAPEDDRPCGKFIRRLPSRAPRSLAGIAAGIALSSMLFLSPVARAQSSSLQSFLKLDGIEGQSTVKGREGTIDILAFTSGVQIDPPPAGGGGVQQPQFFQIAVSKKVDVTSPLLMIHCATRKIFKSASLAVADMKANSAKSIFKGTLTNARITKVETTVDSGSSDKLMETLELSFDRIQWTVTSTNEKGEPVTNSGGYDLVTGTKL